jgi:hypothetical protein
VVKPAPYRPADLADVTPVRVRGRAGRTLGAVLLTLEASFRDRDGSLYWFDDLPVLPSLRAGDVVPSRRVLRLRRSETVRGVRVSGRLGGVAI